MATERPPEGDDREREQRRLERLIPEILRRVLEVGYEKLTEGPENVRNLVSDLKLPKEALSVLLSQLDETKNGLYRAVAREVRDFLEQTNFAEELAKVLTTLSFEVKTEVRFIPNDQRLRATPDVRTKVSVKRDRPSQPPPEPAPPASEPSRAPNDSEEKTE
ncbi:MAG: hypothetical protein ACOY0T_23945 [Myxococcota bacterium]